MPKYKKGFENKHSLKITNLSFEDKFFKDDSEDSKKTRTKVH